MVVSSDSAISSPESRQTRASASGRDFPRALLISSAMIFRCAERGFDLTKRSGCGFLVAEASGLSATGRFVSLQARTTN